MKTAYSLLVLLSLLAGANPAFALPPPIIDESADAGEVPTPRAYWNDIEENAWNWGFRWGPSLLYQQARSGDHHNRVSLSGQSLTLRTLTRAFRHYKSDGFYFELGLEGGVGLGNFAYKEPIGSDREHFGETFNGGFAFGAGFYLGAFSFTLGLESRIVSGQPSEDFVAYSDLDGDGILDAKAQNAKYTLQGIYAEFEWNQNSEERGVDFRGSALSLRLMYDEYEFAHGKADILGLRVRRQEGFFVDTALLFLEIEAFSSAGTAASGVWSLRIGLEGTF